MSQATDLEKMVPSLSKAVTTQATAVEQARAVAEVQAAVVVAQQCPRSLAGVEAQMIDSCSHLAVAERAFYLVPNHGSGASVHLARELARIWGNVTYGVRELRRDDEAGESEIEAFAWDQQANVRSSRTFQVPHQRMKSKERQRLIDLTDIYLNNQNIGARAVRECIFSILPDWFIRAAEDTCRATVEKGDGKPLSVRISDMVKAFQGMGITQDQLEAKAGRKRSGWDAATVAELRIAYMLVTSDGIPPSEVFPPVVTTVDDLRGQLVPEGVEA